MMTKKESKVSRTPVALQSSDHLCRRLNFKKIKQQVEHIFNS